MLQIIRIEHVFISYMVNNGRLSQNMDQCSIGTEYRWLSQKESARCLNAQYKNQPWGHALMSHLKYQKF